MTIGDNSNYALSHPYIKQAVEKYLTGDKHDLKLVFDMLQINVFQDTAERCTRAYRKRRHETENYPLLEEAIREVPPPTRLKVYFPIPPLPKEIGVVDVVVVEEVFEDGQLRLL